MLLFTNTVYESGLNLWMPSIFTSHTVLVCLIRTIKLFYFVVEFEYFDWIVFKKLKLYIYMYCNSYNIKRKTSEEYSHPIKPRLHSRTIYPWHCGMWILWKFLKENIRLIFLELFLRISCIFLVVFRILDFFNWRCSFLKYMILVSSSSYQEYLIFLTNSALF